MVLAVAPVQVPLAAEQVVPYAGLRVGGAQGAQDPLGAVRLPVDPAVLLAQERPGPAAGLRTRDVRTGGEALHGEQDRLQRRVGDLAAVEVALADRRHRALDSGPDVAGVHLRIGLQDGDAPPGLPVLDGPVEGGRAAVADRSRMDDQTGVGCPHLLGDGRAQHRRDHEVRPVTAYGFGQGGVGQREFDRHAVAVVTQLGVDSLREAVERARDEQDVHVISQRRPGTTLARCPA